MRCWKRCRCGHGTSSESSTRSRLTEETACVEKEKFKLRVIVLLLTWSARCDPDIELTTLRLLKKYEMKADDAGSSAHDGEDLYGVTNWGILLHEAMKDANTDIDILAERWKR
eukprot:16442608-Heterocapsa_arctica.AAC.1